MVFVLQGRLRADSGQTPELPNGVVRNLMLARGLFLYSGLARYFMSGDR